MNKRRVGKAGATQALPLLDEVRALIDSARQRAVVAVNAELTLMYWRIGQRIQVVILTGKRAEYGEAIVATLSRQLVQHYGRGFAEKSLRRMVQFAAAFPVEPVVATLSQQLSWSHVVEILPLKDALQRQFYAQIVHRRALERAHPARAHRFHALPADCPFTPAAGADRAGTRRPARHPAYDARAAHA